jgi:hypothetical protein
MMASEGMTVREVLLAEILQRDIDALKAEVRRLEIVEASVQTCKVGHKYYAQSHEYPCPWCEHNKEVVIRRAKQGEAEELAAKVRRLQEFERFCVDANARADEAEGEIEQLQILLHQRTQELTHYYGGAKVLAHELADAEDGARQAHAKLAKAEEDAVKFLEQRNEFKRKYQDMMIERDFNQSAFNEVFVAEQAARIAAEAKLAKAKCAELEESTNYNMRVAREETARALRLEAELAKLRTALSGRTYFHSDEAVEEHCKELEAKLAKCQKLLRIYVDAVGNYRAKLSAIRNETLDAAMKVAREWNWRISADDICQDCSNVASEEIAAAIERLKE